MADQWDAFPDAPGAGYDIPPSKNPTLTLRASEKNATEPDSWDAFPDAPSNSIGSLAKAGGTGVVEGALGLAGIPGAIEGALGNAASAILEKYGQNSDLAKFLLAHRAPNVLPTTESLTNRLENITGPLYQPQTTAEEYARTIGQFLPAIVGGPEGLASKFIPRLASKFISRVAIPAVSSETAGQATKGTAAEKYARLAGGLAGATVGAPVLGRIISPASANPNLQPFVNTLRQEGVPLSAGEATGSKVLRYAENELGDALGAGGKATAANTATLEGFTRAALRRVGEIASRATPEVIHRAFTRIGNQFDRLGARNQAVPDVRFAQEVRRTEQDFHNLTGQQNPLLNNTITRIANAAGRNGGVLPGSSYVAIRSDLARLARQTDNPTLQFSIRDMIHSLDDLMARNMRNPGDRAAFEEARRQYRNMLVIEKAVTGASQEAAQGLITPSKLRADTVTQNRRAYARGYGDFADLARAGEALIKPLPQSGTAPRLAVRTVAHAPAAVAGGLMGGPAGAAGGVALSALLGLSPGMMGRAIYSRPMQAYLGNQVGAPIRNQSTALQLLRSGVLGSLPFRQ